VFETVKGAKERSPNRQGEGGHRVSPQRFAGPNFLYQEDRRAGSEQDVRLWHDPVKDEGLFE
jgi:hypothetical protein